MESTKDMFIFTKEDILDYMNTCGKDAAYGLLLLAGPDGFKNCETYNELEKILKD